MLTSSEITILLVEPAVSLMKKTANPRFVLVSATFVDHREIIPVAAALLGALVPPSELA